MMVLMPNRGQSHRGTAEKIGRSIGGTVGGAIGAAVGSFGHVGRALLSPLRFSELRRGKVTVPPRQPGERPGIESVPDIHTPPAPGTIGIQCIDYGPDRIEACDVTDLDAFLATGRPAWAKVRWVNVDRLHPHTVHQFMVAYGFHTLAAEDVLHVPQRPKLERFDQELFIITRMLTLTEGRLTAEQISLFYRPDLIVSFLEDPGDVWEPIRRRLQRSDSRTRRHDASLLLHGLLDATVDHCFPILEHYGDLLESIEEEAAERPTPTVLHRLHAIKRELIQLRRVMWPMREVITGLGNEELKTISRTARTYLRDVSDHATQVIDIIETYREIAAGLTELYLSVVSNRMNEAIKVLTVIATIFIPITFLAGVYGMNFDYLPELHWKWSYPAFWAVCLATVGTLLLWFRKKGWL
jgi:magnesium transporter